MKRQTKSQNCQDLYDAFKCIQQGTRMKRSRAKDGSIPTHPVVEVMPLKEKEVLAQCLTWLRMKGILCWRHDCGTFENQWGTWGTYGMKSGGDIIGLLPDGIHFEVECKAGKGGRLSVGQQKRLRDIIEHKGVYLVVHGIEEIKYLMKEYV